MHPDWQFPRNDSNEEEGLGNPGIETFRSSPLVSIARESAQNSLDASRLRPDNTHEPVHMVFRKLPVPQQEVPGINSLIRAIESCLARSRERNFKRDIEFFERALGRLRENHIDVLLIEDYGTTGLTGPCKEGTAFHALVKAYGISEKSSPDAGGSFGIGKFSAFSLSDAQTVFYSTIYEDNGQTRFLCQGKSILVSHRNVDDGSPRRATGYWGIPHFQPIDDPSQIPRWLQRTEIGTTVASIAFRDEPEWQWRMAESLVRNFFAAIRDKAITFEINSGDDSPIFINEATLDNLFCHPKIESAAEITGSTEDLNFSRSMDRARKSHESVVRREHFEGAGSFIFTLLTQPELPNRIGILRNGMYLTDNLKHFNDKFRRFSLCGDFVGVLEPEDKATRSLIRELENPRHDELSADRLNDPQRRQKVAKAMRDLAKWVRSTVKQLAATPPSEEILLDEMNRFFSSHEAQEWIQDPGGGETGPEKIKIKPVSSKQRQLGSGPDGDSGSGGGKSKSKPGTGATSGSREGRGRGAAGGRGGSNIPFSRLRTWIPDGTDGRFRTISLEPLASGKAHIEIIAVGAANDTPIDLVRIDGNKCSNTPPIEFIHGQRITIVAEFVEPYYGPLKIVLSRNEEPTNAD